MTHRMYRLFKRLIMLIVDATCINICYTAIVITVIKHLVTLFLISLVCATIFIIMFTYDAYKAYEEAIKGEYEHLLRGG